MDELINNLKETDTEIKFIINDNEVKEEEFIKYIIEKVKEKNKNE